MRHEPLRGHPGRRRSRRPAQGRRARKRTRLVVVGHDARHKSADFARDTAAVMVGAGLRARPCCPVRCRRPCWPSPIRHLGAVAGVAVTAGTDPRSDNGYKVYLGDGTSACRRPTPGSPRRSASRAAGRRARRTGAGGTSATTSLEAYLEPSPPSSTAAPRATCASSTRACTGSVGHVLHAAFVRRDSPPPYVVDRAGRPDRTSRPSPSPTRRSRGRSTCARSAGRSAAPRHRQRPRRRPLRRGRADGRGGWRMCAATRSGRCSARHLCSAGSAGDASRTTIVSSSPAGSIARAGLPPRRDADRLQVAPPGSMASRFGYEEALGLLRRPRRYATRTASRAALAVVGTGRRAEGRRVVRSRPAGRHRPGVRAARHRPASRCGSPTCRPIAGRDGPVAGGRPARWPVSPSSRPTDLAKARGTAADRRPALPAPLRRWESAGSSCARAAPSPS